MAEKIEYWTQQGRQHLYLVVSFLPLADGRERAIEFFMPVGQSGESQQWITSSMRLLSLAARGGFLERALADMRKVAWDRGPVRLGTVPQGRRHRGAAVARLRSGGDRLSRSRTLIARRGGGTAAALRHGRRGRGRGRPRRSRWRGAKCPECGAHAMIRKDGCDFCTQCGHVGSCG